MRLYYVGNLVYENGALKRVLVEGGYVEGGVHHFFLEDYLGNIRVVANGSGAVVQKNAYYPFGMAFAGSPGGAAGGAGASAADQAKQPYKYGGKELDQAFGLDQYDFSARYYDPATARFTSPDPLAEKRYSISPYAYCLNNPIRYIDPDGKREWPVNETYNGAKRDINSGMYRTNPPHEKHGGVDIRHLTKYGQIPGGQIMATHDGIVEIAVAGSKTAGNYIIITNGNISTVYMHMENAPNSSVGDFVKEGEVIGTIGNTGKTSGPHAHHLHYEIRENNEKINPVNGDPKQVKSGDNVNLKDPQKMINKREGENEIRQEKVRKREDHRDQRNR